MWSNNSIANAVRRGKQIQWKKEMGLFDIEESTREKYSCYLNLITYSVGEREKRHKG